MKLTTRSFTFRQLCALMFSIAAGLAVLGLVASAENGNLLSRPEGNKTVSSSRALSQENAGQKVIQPLGAVSPTVTATLTDNTPQATKVNPGSTINYTAVISNGGVSPADDAAGVNFFITLDANSTLVGSAHASPLAFNDTYNWVGNNVLDTNARALPSVTANDVAITDTFTVTPLTNAPTTLGGLVTLGADGHFVYTPEAGDSGTDTFTYTITNTADGSLSGTGTVSINLPVRVWYLQAGASGDGRSNTPSGNPAGISIAANQATDIIYVLFSTSALNGAFTLDGGQQLLGQGVALVANSITLLPAGSSPTITNTGGNVVTLNSTNGGNTISGLIIGDSSGIDITGTNFGLLSVSSVTLNGTGRPLNLSTGTLSATFANLISTSSPGGAGISLTSVGGSLTVSGATSIAGAGLQGISISGSSLAANFGASTTIGSTTQGILVSTSTGNISFGNTTITAGTDGVSLQNNSVGTRSFGSLSTTNGSGVGFLHAVGGGSTTVSGQTTITNPGGRGIDIQDSTTSVTFSNVNVTQSGGTGVFLDDNSGAVSFADLDISPDSGQRAFQATEPHSGAVTTTSGTITTTNATGVEIAGTSSVSRTPLNIQLTTVTVTGGNIAANGILLSNTSATGSPGGFRVLGNAGSCTSGTPTCTGGRIQQTTGADGSTAARGVSLNNADTVVLTRMRIDNHPNFAIKGDNVNGFTLDSSLVDGTNGNNEGLDEAAVKFDNLLGTCAVTASDVSGGREHNFHVLNTSGTLASLSITGSTFRDNQTATGADGVNVDAQGTAVMTVTATSNTFTRNRQEHFRASARNTATMNVHFGSLAAGNTLTGGHPAGLSQSTTFSTESSARLNFNILGNSINGAILSAITIFQANTTTAGVRANGTISGNIIGTAGVANSGSSQGDGIAVTSTGLGTTNVSITNNQIRQFNSDGMDFSAGDTSAGVNLTVTGNTIKEPVGFALNGIHINMGTTVAGAVTGCVDIGGAGGLENDVVNGGLAGNGGFDIRPRQRNSSSVRLPGYVGGASDTAAITAYLQNRNTGAPTVSVSVSASGSMGFLGGAACTQPTAFGPIIETTKAGASTDLSGKAVGDARAVPEVFHVGTATPPETMASQNAIQKNDKVSTHHPSVVKAHARTSVSAPASHESISQNLPVSGETINVPVGTLPAGKSFTIKFSATVNNPPGARQLSTQGTVSGSNFSSIVTDDPDSAGANEPTITQVNTVITWDGDSSTDWNTGTNWDTGFAPVPINDVVIPNTGNQPNLSVSNATIYSLNVAAGRTLTVTPGRIIAITGTSGSDLILNGVIDGGALQFVGAGPHNIFNAGGTGSLSSTNLTTVVNGAVVLLNNNLQLGTLNVDVGGSMDITNRTLSLSGINATLTVGGTLNLSGSTVVLNSTTSSQTIAALAYNNLTINTTSVVNLVGPTTVNGILTFTNGLLLTGAHTLTIGSAGTIIRTSGHVVGTLKKTAIPNGSFTFTVGTGNGYTPLVLANASGGGDLTVTTVATPHPVLDPAHSLQEYWTLTEGGTVTADLTFTYLESDVVGNEATYQLIRISSGTPVSFLNSVNAGANTATLTAVSNFSDWTVGEPITPTAASGIVSGRITRDDGTPVEGVVIGLSGTQTRKTITDADGNYRFDRVEINGFYTVTPGRVNHVFSPSLRTFNQLAERTEAAFEASFTGDGANPLDTAEYFIRQQYVDILGREPDEGGFNYWSNRILECGSDLLCINERRRDVAAAFFIEQEFQQTGSFIYDIYKGALGRQPIYSEYAADRRLVVGGSTLEADKLAFAQAFVQRAEFLQKYQSNSSAESFVDAFLASVQQSSGVDLTGERDSLLSSYNGGANQIESRSLVLRDVADSSALRQAEYNSAFVLTEYFGYLRRDPDTGGYLFWLDVLNNRVAGDYRSMVCAFVTSPEYQRRFSAVVSRSNADCGP